MNEIRTRNFLRILRATYGGSASKLESDTGYSANMTNQIKSGKKKVGDKLARRLERDLRLEPGALDRSDSTESPRRREEPLVWPFSVSLSEIQNLSQRQQRDLDEWLRRMVIGLRAEHIASSKQKRSG